MTTSFAGFRTLYYQGICDQDGRNWTCTEALQYVSRDGTVGSIGLYVVDAGTNTNLSNLVSQVICYARTNE
jgi:hypothetical protein